VHQNAWQNHYVRIANRSLENVAQFRYFGTAERNENLIREEIKRRLDSGNECLPPSSPELVSSHLLFKNIKIRICMALILPVVPCRFETRSLTLKEEHSVWKQDAEENIWIYER
jgi:hypothetical protein